MMTSTTSSAAVGLVYHRTPDPQWVERLRAITGDNPNLPTLHLHWEPGDEWGPVQRWLVYQTWPDSMVRFEYIRECKGPHPRSSGAFDKRRGYWVGGPCQIITRSQWEIYRAIGRYGTPYWVIQGDRGGHKYRLTKWESKMSVLCNGPVDTPQPGDLAYAEPDERTWAALGASDRMRESTKTLEYMMRRPFEFTDGEKAAAMKVAASVLQWCGLQAAEHADELAWALKRDSTIPRPAAGAVVEELDEDTVIAERTADLMHDMT